jgi:16S rRNA (guanine966-N2)-methyltransferase
MDGPAVSERPPGRVRIVGGSRRGQGIRVPLGAKVRPTGHKVREAIFDVLGPVAGLRGLDLFAGTGAMGLEALSRGAADCVFVESDPAVAAVLCSNIEALSFESAARIIRNGYLPAVKSLVQAGASFDLLFVDPPYRMLAEVEVLLTPLLPQLLSDDGVVVVEGGKAINVTLGQTQVFERVYGDTKVTMIRL